MAYEKLTLKYRPKTLDDLLGQDSVVNTVRGMFKRDSVNRTLMISGPFGSGKTTLARLIATYANCEGLDENGDPCGECQVCKQMQRPEPSWADYSEKNAAKARGIDDIRSLCEQAQFMPASKFRVFVLDEVHQLTPQAFEALLKILEEPPRSTMFILCTTAPYKVPKAVASRCGHLKIQPVAPQVTAKILARVVTGEKLDTKVFGDELLQKIAVAVNGHPRNAIETLESVVNNIEGRGGVAEVDDVDALVLEIAEEVVGVSPDKVAATFLLSIYRGKFTGAILALSDVGDHLVFVDTLLQFHTEAMGWRFSPKLQDKMMYAWHAKLKEVFGEPKKASISPEALAAIMDVLIEVSSKLKTYTVDGYYALYSTAVKSALICKAGS